MEIASPLCPLVAMPKKSSLGLRLARQESLGLRVLEHDVAAKNPIISEQIDGKIS